MRNLIVGLVVGVGVGVIGTLGVQYFNRRPPAPVRQEALLLSTAPHFLEDALPGAKTVDVSVQSPSEHSVNYVYEALYDVHLTYQQGDQVKSICPSVWIRGRQRSCQIRATS